MTYAQQDKQPDSRFSYLGAPARIWAVSAIHAEPTRLAALHDALYPRLRAGDRLIYLGNYIGHGAGPAETIDELLLFRRSFMSIPGVFADDVVYLRGGQEEMWQKLMQIQFAPDPMETMRWMMDNGMAATLRAYGLSPRDGLVAAHEGVLSLTRWTAKIRDAARRRPGHETFSTHWRRAAFTCHHSSPYPMLFVHAGLNPSVSLDNQGDSFWWGGKSFCRMDAPYNPYRKVVRGFDPAHGGLHLNCVTATIDGGCGFGGTLICTGFDGEGQVFDMIEA